jgi:hypothetical protein
MTASHPSSEAGKVNFSHSKNKDVVGVVKNDIEPPMFIFRTSN